MPHADLVPQSWTALQATRRRRRATGGLAPGTTFGAIKLGREKTRSTSALLLCAQGRVYWLLMSKGY